MSDHSLGKVIPSFWQGKKVLLTGHTGFKGGWLSLWLSSMGAIVSGFSLKPNTSPNLFDRINVRELVKESHYEDIRDLEKLYEVTKSFQPEIVIHMAAQPLVRNSYISPVETYSTNVMGTVNLLDVIRRLDCVKATVVVTTDKCYENKEWVWGYRENEAMGGFDPYSNSKGCAELVVSSFRQSFFGLDEFSKHKHALASARAGNVIGGGDWSEDRLIPDALRAFDENRPLIIRNPLATRPWQHVLEPLSGYLVLAQALYLNGIKYASAWNFGPKEGDSRQVQEVINLLIENSSQGATWRQDESEQPHEATSLKLDCSKAFYYLNWKPIWSLERAVSATTEWHNAFKEGENMQAFSLEQIRKYQTNFLN